MYDVIIVIIIIISSVSISIIKQVVSLAIVSFTDGGPKRHERQEYGQFSEM